MQDTFHPLKTSIAPPPRLNDPFCYEPHPLCRLAARAVTAHLAGSLLGAEVAQGKMLGVLVCRRADGQLGFLAAYSGQLGGREDWPWFVPAVFDYLQPDGYFKREEAAISAINQTVAQAEASSELKTLRMALERTRQEADDAIGHYKALMAQSKARRDALRGQADQAELVRESQFQKAELKRLKQHWNARLAEAQARLLPAEQEMARLRTERHRRSDALQRWLFDQFVMLNGVGERRTLTQIFATTPQRVPPAGAGECCAPKLLQYAFAHSLQPLCMAEFWQGSSPRQEVRHDGQYYPACRGKCRPILSWMLTGTGCEERPAGEPPADVAPRVVYEDAHLLVVEKPAGLLSVPGKTGEASAESLLSARYGSVRMVHRLDQATSGLLVAARTAEAYRLLQQQFAERTVYKQYLAIVDGPLSGSGTVSLPLRPDLDDRPRQVVDPVHGKKAVTRYEALRTDGGRTLVALTPLTGRTHQLRMHCAHAEGLGLPIVGDRLYGKPAQRLFLHAAELAFSHPVTGERLTFSSAPSW